MQSDLYPQPLDVLREVFGYQSFRSGQDAVIEQLVAGNDVLAIMPTGGGKSLCYQIPALVRPGLAIVVSPLIALIKDQVDALRANGVAAAGLWQRCVLRPVSADGWQSLDADGSCWMNSVAEGEKQGYNSGLRCSRRRRK